MRRTKKQKVFAKPQLVMPLLMSREQRFGPRAQNSHKRRRNPRDQQTSLKTSWETPVFRPNGARILKVAGYVRNNQIRGDNGRIHPSLILRSIFARGICEFYLGEIIAKAFLATIVNVRRSTRECVSIFGAGGAIAGSPSIAPGS